MRKLLIISALMLTFNFVSAQIEGDPDTGSSVPVDGGIVTVTLIAAAYGAKRKSKQKEESNDDI
jgi:hypothetical protein